MDPRALVTIRGMLPGMQRLGPYVLLQRVGRGGMGEAWKAFDPIRDDLVVIKTMLLDDDVSRERFHREGKLLASVRHPNIVRVLDADVFEDTPFIVMELVEGVSVAKLLGSGRGPLPRNVALHVMTQIALGLAVVHDAGIVHRDVSSQNVMVAKDGTVKLIDFGIARSSDLPELTAPGQILGKPGYMAPEQYLGLPVDARADVFGAGVVFYELLTGKRPYGRSSGRREEVMKATIEGAYEPLDTLGLTGPLATFVERAMHPKQEQRPANGHELLAALRDTQTPAATVDDDVVTIQACEAIAPDALTEDSAEHRRLLQRGRTEVQRPSTAAAPLVMVAPAPPSRPLRLAGGLIALGLIVGLAFVAGRFFALDDLEASERSPAPGLRAAASAVARTSPGLAEPRGVPATDDVPSAASPSNRRRRVRRAPSGRTAPSLADQYFERGKTALLMGSRSDAETQLLACLEEDPSYADCHRNLAVLYAMQNNTPGAVKHYRRYIELKPDAKDADRVRAMLNDVEGP